MEDYTEQIIKVPRLHAYALLHYYVLLGVLGAREKTPTERFLQVLAEQDIFPPESKQLAGKVQLPDALLERSLFSLRGEEDKRYIAESRVLSDETASRRADCTKLFDRIYLRSGVPFSGEAEEHRVFDIKGGKVARRMVPRESTEHVSRGDTHVRLSRFDELLDGAEEGPETELSAYAAAHGARGELFSFGVGSMASLMT